SEAAAGVPAPAPPRGAAGAAERRRRLAAPSVRYRRSAIAAERLGREPNAGRGLAALVLGPVDQRDGALDHVRVEAVGRELLPRGRRTASRSRPRAPTCFRSRRRASRTCWRAPSAATPALAPGGSPR